MQIYLAPMEGLTGHFYRRAHHSHYQPMDKYFTPFIAPAKERSMKTREYQDLLPEHNQGMRVIPQILTNQGELFVKLAHELGDWGYDEVNLNVGCPSATVTSKGKGAGFLAKADELDRFLEYIFDHCQLKISVKTRLGIENPDEFQKILAIYNRYPMCELILHPRVLKDYYQNHPHMEAFDLAVEQCKHPLVYNGDLFTADKARELMERYHHLKGIMLGRGVIAQPGLADEIRGFDVGMEQFCGLHRDLYEGYKEYLSGGTNVLYRMKEYWFYMSHCLEEKEYWQKKIRKTQKCREYEAVVQSLFREASYQTTEGFRPPLKKGPIGAH